ncbi:putative ribonuclease H-like domain-containing protein [Tanacetum coccineum]
MEDMLPLGGAKGGRITGKGTLKTGKLDFEDVYFVKQLQFNLFSVLQMCDKKNSVLFTNTGCFVLSPDFKLADESQVLLKVPRKNNMYSVDLRNIIPKESLTCLIAKATLDESMEFSIARNPQQNSVAERRNRTLIKAARLMLADSKLSTKFLAEAVNTACYVQNKVLVVKHHNKTPYELFRGITPSLSFIRPFGCHVSILNTLDHLGKFDGKSDAGLFVGYSLNSKPFRVYNIRTKKVEENLHVRFLEDKPIIAENASNDESQPSSDVGKKDDAGGIDNQEKPESSYPDVNTDGQNINTTSANDNTGSLNINTTSLTVSTAPPKTTHADFFRDEIELDMSNVSTTYPIPSTPNTRIHKDHSLGNIIGDV